MNVSNENTTGSLDQCPLPWADQRRNLILFALCTGMQYLAAPVLYVGITQASLCDRLEADARTSNLPGMFFFAMTAMPAIIAWFSPRVSALKRNLMACYATCGVMLAIMALVLSLPLPNAVKLTVVILQGGVSGATMPAAIAFLWEVIGRGSAESRRGLALSLGFGCGPMLAVAGSFAQTMLLGGDAFGWKFDGIEYPGKFVILFGAGAPVMLTAAILSRFFVVPPVAREPQREPLAQVSPLFAGVSLIFCAVILLHVASHTAHEHVVRFAGYAAAAGAVAGLVYYFRSLLRQRVLLLATIVTILVYSGNMIPSNMNLYAPTALGVAGNVNEHEAAQAGEVPAPETAGAGRATDSKRVPSAPIKKLPEKYAGIQNMLRFGFKMIAGGVLGWLLTRTNPRTGILATSSIFLLSQVWAICVTGPWYLVAFGIFGAGELIGVYSPNYIVSASRTNELRRNMAFATMMMVPAAPAGYLYGAIVDFVRIHQWTALGMQPDVLGFRLSFLTCSLLIASGITFALVCLPTRPHPDSN